MNPSRPGHPPAGLAAFGGLLIAILVALAALAPAITSASAASRQAESGSLTWGVRRSFRNYIVGPIAHGSVTLGGGASTSLDGAYLFPLVSGSYDPATGALSARFAGSVHFQGHDYGNGSLLNLTFSNFRIEASGASGTLFADALSAGLESADPGGVPGPLEAFNGVALANLGGISPSLAGESLTVSGVTANLASSGVSAFAGFYNAGEPLDPISMTIALAAAPTPVPTQAPTSPTATPTAPASTPSPSATGTASPTTSTATATATATAVSTASATPASTVTPVPAGSVLDPGDLDPTVAPVSVVIKPGESASLTDGAGRLLVNATLENQGGGPAAVLIARYASSWEPRSTATLGVGGRAYDIHVGAAATLGTTATLTVTFGDLTPNQPLVWWDGNGWAAVTSGGAAVYADASGRASIVLGVHSSPTLQQLSGTPIGTRQAGTATPTPGTGTDPSPSSTTSAPTPAAGLSVTPATASATPRPPATGSGDADAAAPTRAPLDITLLVLIAMSGAVAATISARARGR